VEPEQAPDHGSDWARRDFAKLRPRRFLPDADDNHTEQDQGKRDFDEDHQDEYGDHV